MGWLIERAVPVDGLVVDPYAGSCSTLIAARLSGRYAIGIEADPRHIAPAIERLGNAPA
jgi:site-specific DNA-methyltransferase (adenine-specific)